MSNLMVQFEITDEGRFQMLCAILDALCEAKRTENWADEAYWLSFIDADARSHFWWPTPEEVQDWLRRWYATPLPQRHNNPSLDTPWSFGSMIEAFKDGDYDLKGCRRVSDQVASIEFDPHGWPYGGTGCMEVLIEAFGHRVIAVPYV